MRDAQSIFDQVVSYCGTTITAQQIIVLLNVVDQEFFFRVSDCIKAHDAQTGLLLVEEIVRNGFDIKEFLTGLAEHFRNLLIARATQSARLIEAPEVYRVRYTNAASLFDEQDILRLIKLTTDLESSIRYSSQPRFKLEVGIIQMTKMEQSVRIDALLQQLDELKKKLNSGNQSPSKPFSVNASLPSPTQRPTPSIQIAEESSSGYVLTPIKKISDTPKLSLVSPQAEPPVPVPPAPIAGEEGLSSGHDLLEQVKQEWGKIVDDARRKKISVGTILGESAPINVAHETLQIACVDDFHFSSLKRNQMFLTDTVNTLLGTKLRIEPVLQPTAVAAQLSVKPASHENSGTPSNSPQTKEVSPKEHPLIETLYRDFGAERV